MSKTIKETFVTIINEGYKSTERITDPFQKATALASLGQALALSGMLSTSTQIAEPTAETETAGKDSLKAESGKGKSKSKSKAKNEVPEVNEVPPVEEEEIETPPVDEAAEQEEGISDEWTEEASALKAEQLELLGQYVEAWEASYVYGECIPAYLEDGSIVADEDNYYEYIRPTNIDGFLAYLELLANE